MPEGSDPAEMTALELATLYREGSLSPVEAARACLQRIGRHNDAVNAFCLVDEEATLDAARRAEERFRRLQPLGLMDGIPVGVKDMFVSRGWPNRKGSAVIPDTPCQEDAPVVAALRRQGYVPLGRTTTPEFGWKGVTDSPLFGITGNPYDPAKTSGGSSGGSAAAIPLGMAPVALGTDAGGSIRIPAGFCGVVGHKPTLGRVPMWPASAFAPLAHPGPLAWTVEDAALLMNIMCEPDRRDTTLPPGDADFLEALAGGIGGWRVAYSPDLGFARVDAEVAAAVERAVRVLEDLGARVERTDPGFSDPRAAFDVLFFGGAANALREIPPEQRARMDAGLVEAAEAREDLTMLDYLGAMNQRAALMEHMEQFHCDHDLLVTPTLPIPAFTAGLEVPEGWHDRRWPSWTPLTYPFNMTGQPACSVPCGYTGTGLPIGLQFIGPRHGDAAVLRAAHAYQLAEPLTDRRPH